MNLSYFLFHLMLENSYGFYVDLHFENLKIF